ncbi:DUF922 domain-containing protein [Lacinutrix jangbogonensis]|uniref:DUF922 domain-containing protein n=1 Tax=Lacinutrix jangbogonensis TaxID=1469557 RepID=UPI00053D53BD|nr:DUF922 domain-containing protein [Lacinutrix jangbogonensis]
MKYSILIFFIAFQNVVISQEESTISWKPTLKLSWLDFQGEVSPDVYGKANTSYKIEIVPADVLVDEQDNIQDYEKLTVDARFYKKQSWTTVLVSDTIVLNHEQLHFDIAELFARKVRKRFRELQKEKEARFSVYSKEYGVLWRACRKYQKQFDFETDHGRALDLNKTWSNKIKEALIVLEAYK